MPTGERLADARRRLLARIDGTAADAEAGFPHAADGRTGRWERKARGSWTGGFWVGSCWLYTGEAPDHELVWGDYFLLEALLRWGQLPCAS